MTFKHVFFPRHMRGKTFAVTLVTYGHADESCDIFPYLLGIQKRMITFDDAAGFKFFYSLHHCRRREIHFLGNLREMTPAMVLKNGENFYIGTVLHG